MKNALERFRVANDMSYAALARAAGFTSRAITQRHCTDLRRITAEAALRYHRSLGIPLSDLRPDLWPAGEEDEKR